MSALKLFHVRSRSAFELPSQRVEEKSLQSLMEAHLHAFLGIHFLASEYSTGRQHRGRIDTLGLDEQNAPVILEYKRSMSTSLINQGLYYLDWLLDHRAEFRYLVQECLGARRAKGIDWNTPCVICVAADYTRYDRHAAKHIAGSIEMVRYRIFASKLVLLEYLSADGFHTIGEEEFRPRGGPRQRERFRRG